MTTRNRVLSIISVLFIVFTATSCAQLRARAPGRVSGGAVSATERALVVRINQLRTPLGLAPVTVHPELMRKARAWAAHMAAGGCGRSGGSPVICHSDLTDGITVQWTLLAENVGAGSPRWNVRSVEIGLEGSALHLANIRNPSTRYVGVGVATWHDNVYVAQEFMAP